MIRAILLIFALFSAMPAISQKLQIRNQNRDMRAGFTNSFEFSLDRKFDSVDLKVTQGTVLLKEKNVIQLIPEVSGKDTLFLRFFNRAKRLYSDTSIFEIIKPEVFPAYGANLFNRKLSLKLLKAMGGIVFYIRVNDYHWEPVTIASYRFSIIRNGNSIYSKVEYSNRFNTELNEKLEQLMSGDIILINDTKIDTQYYKHVNVLPGVFEIE